MLIYGINPVVEALRTGAAVSRLFVAPGKDGNPRIRGVLQLANKLGITVEAVANVERLTGSRGTQGVAAELPPLEQPLPPDSELSDHLVMFDGIMDPHNFGAALRVCEVFGFDQVIYHRGNSSGITASAIKVSAGAAFHLHVYECNLNKAVRRLQDLGYSILVLDSHADVGLYDCPLPPKFCLVIGSEDQGVRHAIKRLATHLVAIPMRGRLDSLNVSCALSAALSEISRRLPWPGAESEASG